MIRVIYHPNTTQSWPYGGINQMALQQNVALFLKSKIKIKSVLCFSTLGTLQKSTIRILIYCIATYVCVCIYRYTCLMLETFDSFN